MLLVFKTILFVMLSIYNINSALAKENLTSDWKPIGTWCAVSDESCENKLLISETNKKLFSVTLEYGTLNCAIDEEIKGHVKKINVDTWKGNAEGEDDNLVTLTVSKDNIKLYFSVSESCAELKRGVAFKLLN